MKLNIYNFNQIPFIFIGLVFLVVSSFADNSQNILSQIQTTYNQISDFRATLTQTNTDTTFKLETTYTGEVYFQKPA
ncbi:MAG: hypothetical protein QME64_04795, partial [bacterium]|nr:hypothetical protein [bacterium]